MRNALSGYAATAQALMQDAPVRAEAELFARIATKLEGCSSTAPHAPRRIKAIADARRLWLHSATFLADANNALPRPLRASLISVALAVLRELDSPEPDLAFVAETTRVISDGLFDAARYGMPAVAQGEVVQA